MINGLTLEAIAVEYLAEIEHIDAMRATVAALTPETKISSPVYAPYAGQPTTMGELIAEHAKGHGLAIVEAEKYAVADIIAGAYAVDLEQEAEVMGRAAFHEGKNAPARDCAFMAVTAKLSKPSC